MLFPVRLLSGARKDTLRNPDALLAVDDIAAMLGIHVRTVRRYLREGRLKGVKIGRQYRVAASDLAVLTGQTEAALQGMPGRHHSEASVVVQVDSIDAAAAARVMSHLGGAIKGRDKHSDTPLRVDTVYDEPRARLKVIGTGSLANAVKLLQLVEGYLSRRS